MHFEFSGSGEHIVHIRSQTGLLALQVWQRQRWVWDCLHGKKQPIKWNWISWNFLILCHQFVSQICSSNFALSKAWLNLRHHRLWACEKKKIHFLLSSYFWNVWFSGREERDGFLLLGWGYTESEPSVWFNLSQGYLYHLSCLQNCHRHNQQVSHDHHLFPRAKFRPRGNAQLGDADLYLHMQSMGMFLLVDRNNAQMVWRGMGAKKE